MVLSLYGFSFQCVTVQCRHSIHESWAGSFLNGSNCGLQYYGVICGLYYFHQQSKILWQYVFWLLTVASAWQLPSLAKMGSDGSEHCIGFTFSSILQNSVLIDLHHSASVWVCELFVFICLPHTLYVLPENLLFFFWSKLFNDFKLQRMNVFVYCVGLPTQFAVSIHWIINNLTIMRMVCMYVHGNRCV